jgi:hypothetical protein
MEAVSTSEASVNIYQTARRNISEDSYLHNRRLVNLKSHHELIDFVYPTASSLISVINVSLKMLWHIRQHPAPSRGYFILHIATYKAAGYNCQVKVVDLLRLKAFAATEIDKLFSGNKPCQLWIKAQRFGDHLRLHYQGRVSADTACCPKRTYLVDPSCIVYDVYKFCTMDRFLWSRWIPRWLSSEILRLVVW